MSIFSTKPFSRREDGSLSIEAVLALPFLVWAILATLIFWDAFRTLNVSQKATYTVADMISREQELITPDYLQSVHEIYDYLAASDGENKLRISLVEMVPDEDDADTATLTLLHSCVEGNNTAALVDVSEIEDRIPLLAAGDQLIVVESEQEWAPNFAVGLATYRFYELALAIPREGRSPGFDENCDT